MALNRKGGSWLGGYVSVGRGGRRNYVIERMVRGHRFHVATRAQTERAALRHLERFEADPLAYRPEGAESADPLVITRELASDYLEWMQRVKRNGHRHCVKVMAHLASWAEDLDGQDLRAVTLMQLKTAVAKHGNVRQRIAALKAFCKWLRTERGLMTSAQDISRDLPIPPAIPQQYTLDKAVDVERLRRVIPFLSPKLVDLLLVLCDTGMHMTEIAAFARHDPNTDIVLNPRPDIPAVIVVRHKSKRIANIRIDNPDVIEAALRIRKRGQFPGRPTAELKLACKAAGVPPFEFGWMRHTFTTAVLRAGDPLDDVARQLHHVTANTTRRVYARANLPPGQPLTSLALKVLAGGKS